MVDHTRFMASKLLNLIKEAFSLSSTLKNKVLPFECKRTENKPCKAVSVKCKVWLLLQFLPLITKMQRVSLAAEFKTLNKLDLRAEHRKSHKKINAKSFKFFSVCPCLEEDKRNTFLKHNY